MRKVYQKLSSLWLLLIAFLAVPSVALAQDIPSLDAGEGEESTKIKLHEDFDYATGNLIDQDKWLQYGNNTAGRIQVVDNTLEYPNYPGGVKGKSIQLKPEVSGEDLCIRFDPSEEGIKSGYIYYSALINVTQLPEGTTSNAQTCVVAFLPRTKACNVGETTSTGAAFSSTELGKLFVVKADDGLTYKIGIDRGGTKAVYADGTFELNTTQLVVVKYGVKTGIDGDKTYDEVALYVNPTDFTTEPETPSAQTNASTTGSQTGLYGIQGFELRQGSNSNAKGPELYVGALHFAQTYADLFTASEGGDTPSEPAIPATPTINVSKTDDFIGETFMGYPKSKTFTVKGTDLTGDVTVEIAGTEVTADKTTLSKEEVESEEGAQLTLTVTPTSDEQQTLVTFRSEGAEDVTIQYGWQAIAYTDVAKLRDITPRDGGDYDYYRYTGKAIVSFVDKTTNNIYVQDSTAAIIISGKDPVEAGITLPEVGDSITGFLGTVEQSWGSVVFTPDVYLGFGQLTVGTVVSQGNEVEPVVATLAEIKAAPNNYLNKVVRINGVEVTTEAATFAEGMTQPTISDGTESGKMRIFKGTSLIGAPVPVDEIDLIGLSTSASAVIIAPRSADDLQEAVSGDPELTVDVPAIPLTEGKVGQTLVLGTIHVSAKNMPAATSIEITGANRAMFAASVTEIKAGSSETDVEITYTPTAIGKHTGYVNIDCPEVPELSQSFKVETYAIDEQNPPTITTTAADLDDFEAKVGEQDEQTITITTANLPDYANVKLATADVFRISSTMLMKNAETPLKVTFVPLAVGTYENELIISTLGADTIRIPLKGVATDNTTPAVPVEGDELPLNPDPAVTLLNEHFDNGERNKPLSIEGWKNIAIEGTRAWWSYSFNDTDESAGEHVAKVTAYDSKVEDGNEEPVEMLLVTPALDFKNAASKIFTFRVRGDYLTDNQSDNLQLLYIEAKGDEMLESPIEGFTMPCTKDESGEWFEYHIDFTDQELADTFFIGFRFTSLRGRYNSATYYIDDVSFGRTDIPVVRPNVPSLAFTATPGKDATSDEVTVTTENLTEPVKLTLGGANKSKFQLTETELPAEGGTFAVKFNSDVEGVHEAYVKLASRGAADKYIALSVNNSVQSGIANISATPADITIYSLDGVVLKSAKAITPAEAVKGLPTGTYILQKADANSIQRFKIAVK